MPATFQRRYGPTALIAGASEGLGAAFARALAARGLDLVLLARRAEPLEQLAAELREVFGVCVRTIPVDLSIASVGRTFEDVAAAYELGIAVYNAAYAPLGPLTAAAPKDLTRAIDVNVRGPLLMARAVAPAMVSRGKGGIVLMSSLAGDFGSPRIATYAGTKAFNSIFAAGLWHELRAHGVDVLASCAGAISTPGYAAAAGGRVAPGTLDASAVARQTLDALGSGPRVTPGWINKLANLILGRLIPRKLALAIMAASTKELR